MVWTFKYKPKNLNEFVDQKEALAKFLNWIKNWERGRKALLFYGMSGIGKTALLEAYANEKNLEFIELNASDFRSALQIREVLGQSMLQAPLFKKGKIFLLDEIDGIVGKEDRGGIGEIIKIIKETAYPVILTSNNPWDPKLRTLRKYCILVEFKKIPVFDIERRLDQICKKENIKTDKEVLRQLAKRSEGDLRSAINDLETLARDKKKIKGEDLEVLGYRKRETNVFEVLKIIFKTENALTARHAIDKSDKDPDELFWWIENNITREYEKPEEIAKAYDALSKADVFKNWIISRQNWRFKAYMIDMMTAGVATAKKEMYRKFTRYQYPSKIAVLGRTKLARADTKKVLEKLSGELHCSTKKIRKEYLPYLKIILKNKEMKDKIVFSSSLTSDDILLLK